MTVPNDAVRQRPVGSRSQRGVRGVGGENGAGRATGTVRFEQLVQGGGPQQRQVGGDDQEVLVVIEVVEAVDPGQHRITDAEICPLLGEADREARRVFQKAFGDPAAVGAGHHDRLADTGRSEGFQHV